MEVGRRGFLRLAGAAATGSALAALPLLPGLYPPRARAADTVARGIMVLVDGIGPATAPDVLRGALAPLLEASVPLTLGLSPAGSARYPPPLAGLVLAALADFPVLVEPAPRVPGLAALSPYFQLRAAAEACAALERDLAAPGRPPVALGRFASLVTDSAPAHLGHDALRAIGLRNILAPGDRTTPPRILACNGDSMCHLGAIPVDFEAEGPTELARFLAADGPAGGAALLLVDAARLPATDSEAHSAVARLRDAIVAAVAAGTAFVTAPRQQLAWLPPEFGRRIGLRLVPPSPGDAEAEEGRAILRASLAAAGFGLSETIPPGGGAEGAPAEMVLGLGTVDAATVTAIVAAAGRDPQVVAAGAPDDAGTVLLAEAGVTVLAGVPRAGLPAFDGAGLLHLPEAAGLAQLQAAPVGTDLFLALGPEDFRDGAARARVLDALSAAVSDGRSRILGTAALSKALLPPDPVFAILRETRRDLLTPAEVPAPEDNATRAALLDDARHAWAHLAATTVPATGLSLATLHLIGTTSYSYRALTMWDLGSLILATLASIELDLLTPAEGTARVERLLAAIPTGRALPPERISVDTARPEAADFNACDTGRLLAALRAVDLTPGLRGRGAEIVARWRLGDALSDGRLQSLVGGKAVDATRSPCAHYAARAFAAWGVLARSPLDVAADGSATDWQMRVLEAAAACGPYGAEPLLLEPIELGPSPPGDLLAEVLFAAQARATRDTGLPFCLSEGPLDRAPWFAYDGLRLDDAAERWVSRSTATGPASAPAGGLPGTLRFSTKAAFLWAAARPGALSDRFLATARATRLDTGGFAPGIYLASGAGMPGYSDVNTNAVIVEAVAHILRDRQPIGAPPPPKPGPP